MRIGVSGVRGRAAEIEPSGIMGLCDAFAGMIQGGACAVGRDIRESGPAIQHAAAAVLMQHGLDVLDYGVAPTPVIYRESRRAGAGIMITASHNPMDWNGLKFVIKGRGIDPTVLESAESVPRTAHGNIGQCRPASSTYVADALKLLGTSHDASVALDVTHSAARDTARELLEQMGCTVRIIESSRGPDPTADDLTDLADASRTCNVGLAFDPDGDRVVIARNGTIQKPDATLAVGIAWSLNRGMRKFALSHDTSEAITSMITGADGSTVRARVGEANVVRAMDDEKCDAGGEGSSAGFILPEFNYCRDGILTGAIAASMPTSTLDDALGVVSGYHIVRDKVAAPVARHNDIVSKVLDEMRDTFDDILEDNGFKGMSAQSWVLVRPSNTEDAIRVSVEADTDEHARKLAQNVCGIVKRHGA